MAWLLALRHTSTRGACGLVDRLASAREGSPPSFSRRRPRNFGGRVTQRPRGGGTRVRENKDVVVVGAGLAGLAAGLELEGSDFVVLESDGRVGGRLKSEPRGEYWLNFGAHVFGGADSHVGKLIDLMGLEALPARGSVTGLAF